MSALPALVPVAPTPRPLRPEPAAHISSAPPIAPPPAALPPAPVSNTEHRIDAHFWAKLDRALQSRVPVAHCKGAACNPNRPTCACPCAPCDRRRTLREQAETEIRGGAGAAAAERARTAAPALGARIEGLWRRKVDAAAARGALLRHCGGARCMDEGEGIAVCDCACDGCAQLVALLEEATYEVAEGME